jgi:hypothetical protein
VIHQLLIVWSVLLFPASALAKIWELGSPLPEEGQNLGRFLEFFKSTEENPAHLPIEGLWISLDQESPSFGYTRDSYWARLRIHNPGPGQRVVFKLQGLITQAEMVDPQGRHLKSGISRGLKNDEPLSRLPAFATEIPSGDSVYFFRNLTASKQFPIQAFPEKGFAARNYGDIFILTLCCGVILGLMLYYLLTFLVIRRLEVVLYTSYAFFALVFTLFLSGIARIFVPGLTNILADHYLSFACFSGIFSIAFSAVYLNLPRHNPRMMRIYQFGMLVEAPS